MPKIRVTCPTCATPLELDAEYAGQEVQCGSCHEVFVAKAERTSRPGRDDDGDRPSRRKSKSRREADDEDDDYDDRPRRRRRRAESGGGGAIGTWALVLGVLSIPLACCCGLFSLPASVGGLVCGVIGMRNPDARGSALGGLICSAVGLVLMIATVALGLAMNFGQLGNKFNNRPQQWQQQPQPQPWNPPPPPRRFGG